MAAIHGGCFKLIRHHRHHLLKLYDLAKDPRERHNLIDDGREELEQMAERSSARHTRYLQNKDAASQ